VTPSPSSPLSVQIALIDTPPDADPGAWTYLGTASDLRIEYDGAEPAFELPEPPLSTTVSVDLGHLSWDDVLAQLRTIRFPPHPACSSARERIEGHLHHRRIANMLQAARYSYRFPVPPVSPLSLASLVNPA
jgi:hypothetical protein